MYDVITRLVWSWTQLLAILANCVFQYASTLVKLNCRMDTKILLMVILTKLIIKSQNGENGNPPLFVYTYACTFVFVGGKYFSNLLTDV